MRYVQAGEQQLVVLEPEHDTLRQLVQQAGFTAKITKEARRVTIEASALEPSGPLLLFDAGDPANLGWFSRCQFYVDSVSGVVLQTPLVISNCHSGRDLDRERLRISMATEVPAGFRLAGRKSLSEQVVYALLYNLLTALRETGVALCGSTGLQPLAGAARRTRAAKVRVAKGPHTRS